MIPVSSFRRLALVLAIVPQLIVMGLGQGVVVCIAPGGHVQVEVIGGDCCADATPRAIRDGSTSLAHGEPDCGSCSDHRFLLDPLGTRASRWTGSEGSPSATTAHPGDVARVSVAARSVGELARPPERGRVPQHLQRLRSVLLRC